MKMKPIKKECSIKLYLDVRYTKKDTGKHPVKIKIWTKATRKANYYNTRYEFTPIEWELLQSNKKYKEVARDLYNILEFAKSEADKISPFNPKELIRILDDPSQNSKTTFLYLFNEKLKAIGRDRIGAIENYNKLKKSIVSYNNGDYLLIKDITTIWINGYIVYCQDVLKYSNETTKTYLKLLKAVINYGINNDLIKRPDKDIFTNITKLQKNEKINKALTKIEIITLINAEFEPYEAELTYTKDTFLIMFYMGGIPPVDLFSLKYSNVVYNGDSKCIIYKRKKTNQKVVIPVNNPFERYINEYGNKKETDKDNYIFNVLSLKDTAGERHKKIKNKVSKLNRALKRIAERIGINKEISTYWARHTFATLASGSSMPINSIKESLGHTEIGTTQKYLNTFGIDTKKEMYDKFYDNF